MMPKNKAENSYESCYNDGSNQPYSACCTGCQNIADKTLNMFVLEIDSNYNDNGEKGKEQANDLCYPRTLKQQKTSRKREHASSESKGCTF